MIIKAIIFGEQRPEGQVVTVKYDDGRESTEVLSEESIRALIDAASVKERRRDGE